MADTYLKETKTYEFENGTATVHYPDITDEERMVRHKSLERQTEIFCKEVLSREKENKGVCQG